MQIIVNHYCSDGGINQLAAVLIVYHYDLAVIVNEEMVMVAARWGVSAVKNETQGYLKAFH